MSLLDQARKFEQQIMSRLRELEPIIFEYEQLRKLAERLGLEYTAKPTEDAATATGKRSATRSRGRGRAGKTAAKQSSTARSSSVTAKKATTAKASAKKATTAKRTPTKTTSAKTTTAKTTPAKTTPAKTTTAKATPSRAKTTTANATPSRAKTAGAGRRRSSGRKATARPGQRSDEVLRLVAENPGITVREIGDRLGVDATGLYRIVNRLSDDGQLRKDGPQLHRAAAPQRTPETAGGEPAAPATSEPVATEPEPAADATPPAEH